jgi:hypothetical protein
MDEMKQRLMDAIEYHSKAPNHRTETLEVLEFALAIYDEWQRLKIWKARLVEWCEDGYPLDRSSMMRRNHDASR